MTQRPHLVGTTAHDDVATDVAERTSLEAQLHEGTAQGYRRELLRDAGTHYLQGQRHTDELTGFLPGRLSQ